MNQPDCGGLVSDVLKIVGLLLIMVPFFIIARKVRTAQMIKARDFVIQDLKSKGALDASSAVKLSYSKKPFIRIGFRDDRPGILQQFVNFGVVGMTSDGKFYLNESKLSDSEQK